MNIQGTLEAMLAALAGNPVFERLLWASVELAVLAALVWAGIHVFRVRSPRVRAILWLVVLIKPLTALCLGTAVPLLRVERPATAVITTHASMPQVSPEAQPALSSGAESGTFQQASMKISPKPAASDTRTALWNRMNFTDVLVYGWAVAVALLAVWKGLDAFRLRRLARDSISPAAEIADLFDAAAGALGLRRYPRLVISEKVESPALAGVFRPVVLLPQWMTTGAARGEIDWALRHELAHWKLGDTYANFARQMAQVLFFFHPAVWWAGARWEEDAELACDRALVNSQEDADRYAGSLYQVLAKLHGRRQRFLAGGLCATRTQVGRRIAALLGNPLQYSAHLGLWAAAALLVSATVALGVGGAFEPASAAVEGSPAPVASVNVTDQVAEAIQKLSTTAESQTDRVTAVFDLIKALPNKEALNALCGWLDNDAPTKRRSAVYIIQMLEWADARPAFPQLRGLMKHDEALTRGMASMALASQADTASYDAILEMALHDKDPYARRCAALALGELGDPRAMEPLLEIIKEQASFITKNAQNALDRLTLLADYKDATGDTAKIVRGIYIIAGSTHDHLERINRARALLLATDKSVRDTVLTKLAESPSNSIRNSVTYARTFEETTATSQTSRGLVNPPKRLDDTPPSAVRLQLRWEAKDGATEFDTLPRWPRNGEPDTSLRVEKTAIVDEADIASAEMRQDNTVPNAYSVYFTLKDAAADRFKKETGANVGRTLAIIFEGKIINAPVVRDSIGGEGVVTCPNRALAERIAAIFKKISRKEAPAWSPEQATGAPDTPEAGDVQTAWASLTQDDAEEWLLLHYDAPVKVARILVHETFNPGALRQIDAVNEQGAPRRIWEGQDPTPPTRARGVSEIALDPPETTAAIKLYLDSPAVSGWNEIDAVGLVDTAGNTYWASSAEASSTYADYKKRNPENLQPTTLEVSARSRDLPMPTRYSLLSHVNDTAEDKRSFGGSGHAVRFTRTAADGANLIAVQLGASRYGSTQAPRINFDVYLLDDQFNTLHNAQYAYAEIDQGPLMWYTFRISATAVPETFLIALDFHASQFEGVYLGIDRDSTESHSFIGLPGDGYKPVGEPFDWMIRACLSDGAPAGSTP